MSEQRTYGFRIDEGTYAQCPSVTARILVREGEDKSPINPRGDGEHPIWGAPKKTEGLALADLEIILWRSEGGADARQYLHGPFVRYGTVHLVAQRDAERMFKTLRRINREIEKANATEAGDVLMAVAKAVGATFYVEPKHGIERGSFYSESEWKWGSLADARDKLRAMVEKIKPQEKEGVAA